MIAVYCDPELPRDWEEREQELALREPQLSEPELLQLFRRAVLP